jgi:hypothetical protein
MTTAYQVLGVHIRRGDYVGLENYHGLTSSRYFKNAVQMIQQLSGFEKIMVFSDDIAVAREVFPQGNYYISSQDLDSSPETLILMSRCESFIGSNSSFSWWAAWLNPSPDKVVLSPPHERWLNMPNCATSDVIPDSWIQLDDH